MITVTTITANAGQDVLSEQDYLDIYQEINPKHPATGKPRMSLDKFVAFIGSRFTKATWNNWLLSQDASNRTTRSKQASNRTMRNELRAAVYMPALPLSIEEALSDISQDAEIVEIGNGETMRVIKLKTVENIVVYVNGTITATSQDTPLADRVIEVTSEDNPIPESSPWPARSRRQRYRPELPETCRELIDAVRKRDLDFSAVLRAGLDVYDVLGEL